MTPNRPGTCRAILLIGVTGQIGWELRRTLAPLGQVTAAGRETIDLADPDRTRRAIREAEPSLIVNAAAYTAVDRAEEEESLATAVNGTAPGIMAEEAKRLGIPLIHYSTDYVFDGAGNVANGTPRPYREDDRPAPVNAYGRSKLVGEQAIRSIGPRHLILRTSWVYASRGANFLRTVRRLSAERDELRIVGDQIGSPTWARMVAEATAQIIAASDACGPEAFAPQSAAPGGVYHLSAAGSTSWHGFAAAIVEADAAAGRGNAPAVTAIATRDYPLPATRPAYSVLDNSAIGKAFGIALPEWKSQLVLCLGQ